MSRYQHIRRVLHRYETTGKKVSIVIFKLRFIEMLYNSFSVEKLSVHIALKKKLSELKALDHTHPEEDSPEYEDTRQKLLVNRGKKVTVETEEREEQSKAEDEVTLVSLVA